MATAQTIINRALSLLGVLASGETAAAEDMQAGLDGLNAMVDSWLTERLFLYTTQENVSTLTAGTQTRTIGPTGDIVVARPLRIEPGSYTRLNGVDYPITLIDGQQWASITVKTITGGFPQLLYYDQNLPNGTLNFYPQPGASVELHLRLLTQLSQFADTITDYSLAPGYLRALQYSLAEELGPEFGRPLEAELVNTARKARFNIKRANSAPPQMALPAGIPSSTGRFNIYTGT